MTRSRSKKSKGRLQSGDSIQREAQVAEAMWLALEQHPDLLTADTRLLLIDDMDGLLGAKLTEERGLASARIENWSRFCRGDEEGRLSPKMCGERFDVVLMRIPASKQAFDMHAAMVAPLLSPRGSLLVYGANDEGIKSCSKPLSRHYARVSTLDTRRHCRVLLATGASLEEREDAASWGDLEAWREVIEPHPLAEVLPAQVTERLPSWSHYPGLFARGKLDAATRLLLEHLPELAPGSAVLDFACGPGAISAYLASQGRDLAISMSEADAIALHAASHNVPGEKRCILSDGWHGVAEALEVDVILSNPPIHRGKSEDFTVLRELIARAPGHLSRGGSLILVAQAQVPTERLLEEGGAWSHIERIADDRRFRVWRATI